MAFYLGLLLWRTKYLVLCIFFTFILGFFIALMPIQTDKCNCVTEKVTRPTVQKLRESGYQTDAIRTKHKLAILVPFRDRFEELLEFAPYMHNFLKNQNVNNDIIVLNQVDSYRFNRAALINVGFKEACPECDYVAMHDVDLVPLNPELSYGFPDKGPYHVASPQLHPRYNYSTFVGGILLLKREDFKRVNGMSNKYWGWGLEDDEFYVRLKEAKLPISRPENITTGKNNTFRHLHDRVKRKRDMAKCFNQLQVTRHRDLETGLSTVSYTVSEVRTLKIDNAPVTVLNVKLHCDKLLTPWCECVSNNPSAHRSYAGSKQKRS